MRVSAKAEYACRAVLELAKVHKITEVIQINDIAIRQNIPRKYLVQILLQLQRAGLVKSKRGASGGYMLARGPADITLGDVLRTTDGALLSVECLEEKPDTEVQGNESDVAMREVWKDVQQRLENIVDEVTFEDICRKVEQSTSMYYI
ncbi:MAG: Rrf2 family transcriptional regulator [Candidatus Latescibacteria bacterium]|mgnify:CR=1 FL=1|jgi:Rrf2 family transcriptional regulator, cysteine metabolism repressor|nr:Rrf2 family transcriptional regulator [Candidatus Latescibacterota bacterium]